MLTPPPYIVEAGFMGKPIRYKWENVKSDAYNSKPNEPLRRQIRGISDRGVLALSLGFAEWIAWRSPHKEVDTTVLPALEEIWAGLIDWKYFSPSHHFSWDKWSGPVLSPLAAMFSLLSDVIRLTKTQQFASPEAVCLARLVEHVLPDPKPFIAWRRVIIPRLLKTHPDRKNDPLGKPVPREALDPAFPYSAKKAPELLFKFLAGLDYKKNRFLATPAEMKKAGFKGVPYSYGEAGDRTH